MQQTKKAKYTRLADGVAKYSLLSAAAFSIVALFAIVAFLLWRGVPAMAEVGFFKFLFGTRWHPDPEATNPTYGILPMVLGSLYVTTLATLIGIIVGLFIAIFIYKLCPRRLASPFMHLINLLSGIPSVIYGLFGLLIVVPFLREKISPNFVGDGILAASTILSIMILPTIVSISVGALKAVPNELYEGALALGATKEQCIFRVMLPAAKSGVFAAVVLSIGRAIGETMAVIMVIGGSARIPTGIMQSVDTLTALIARSAGEAYGLGFEILIAVGVILLAFTLALNAIMMRIKTRTASKQYKSVLKRSNQMQATSVVGGLKAWYKTSTNTLADAWSKLGYCTKWCLSKTKLGFVFVLQKTRIVYAADKFGQWIDKTIGSSGRQNIKYSIYKGLAYFCAGLGLLALLGIVFFILYRGIAYVSWDFVFGKYTTDKPTLAPALVGTLILIGIAIVIAVPIGIGSAIFLSEYARNAKGVKYIRLAIESLAAIPSIVYGLFGYIVFVTLFGWSYSMLAGGLALAIMTLPTIIRITEESLLAVHATYREASRALGASKVRTTFRVILPTASQGVVNAIIQAVGRVISESAVLILTIGLVVGVVPNSAMRPGSSLALNIYYWSNHGYPELAAATGVVLLVLVLALNFGISWIGRIFARGKR